MTTEIVPFNPQKASRAEWARFHRFRRLRQAEREPEDPVLDDETIEKWMKRPDPYWDITRYAAVREEGEQIGALHLEVAKEGSPDFEENGHLAHVHPEVLIPHRRRGIGLRLLAQGTKIARGMGKSLIILGSDEDDGKAFIEAIGAKVASQGRQSRLYLDRVDWEMLEAWVEEGPKRSPETQLTFYTGPIPDEIIEEYSEAFTEVYNQQPRDELKIGDEAMTPERIREWEAKLMGAGGRQLLAATTEPDGHISGLTELGYFPGRETFLHQFMTGVREPDRGRGLGKWIKAANLLRARHEFPSAKVVITGNATTNAAMLSINERMGFKPHREGVEAQIDLKDLESRLKQSAEE